MSGNQEEEGFRQPEVQNLKTQAMLGEMRRMLRAKLGEMRRMLGEMRRMLRAY
jgi:hypothetical protein